MEITKTDGLKEIKSSFSISSVNANLVAALNIIKTICEERDYIVDGSIDKIIIDINLHNSTLTSRKKLARKIYYFMKKKSRKTMSALLTFIRRRFLGEDYKISIKLSLIEQQIIALRTKYKGLRSETEEARLKYRKAKELFKEKKSVYDN